MKSFKTVGIIGAMDEETMKISAGMKNLQKQTHAKKDFFIGNLGEYDVVLATCGIGKVNAAITAQIMIDLYGVDCIINTGIAGSLHPDVKTCDIVISSDAVYHDFVTDIPELMPRIASEKLVSAVKNIIENSSLLEEHKLHIGRIATGDQFIMDNKKKDEIISMCENPLCVEMEGAAIAHTAEVNDIPFVIIRAVSDSSDEQATVSFYELKDFTANLSASTVIALLEN